MDGSMSSSDDFSGSSSFPSSSFSSVSSLSDGSSFSLSAVASSCRQFSLDDINEATNNFDEERVVGKGGEGKVYLGEIYLEEEEGKTQKTRVAVKQLNKNSTEFENEIRTVAKIKHPNLVALLGYCNESDEKILIYEYMGNGTLSNYVKKDNSVILSWKQRLNICIGAASGLQHLHRKTDQFRKGIIHRDVKPANILIDENWVAKISDFGMFKLSDANQNNSTMITRDIKGTRGYFAPEYLYYNQITRKIDVYAFGVVLFEVLCRKTPWDRDDDESVYLGENEDLGVWARENVDDQIKAEISEDSLTAFTKIIGKSLLKEPHKRPTMDGVVQNLMTALKCHDAAGEDATIHPDTPRDEGDASGYLEENESLRREPERRPTMEEGLVQNSMTELRSRESNEDARIHANVPRRKVIAPRAPEAPQTYTYIWNITKFSDKRREQKIRSGVFTFATRKWELILYPNGNGNSSSKGKKLFQQLMSKGKHLSLHFVADKFFPSGSFSFKLRIRDQLSSSGGSNYFSCDNDEHDFKNFMLLSNLSDSTKGYLRNDTMILDFTITSIVI